MWDSSGSFSKCLWDYQFPGGELKKKKKKHSLSGDLISGGTAFFAYEWKINSLPVQVCASSGCYTCAETEFSRTKPRILLCASISQQRTICLETLNSLCVSQELTAALELAQCRGRGILLSGWQ